MWFPLRLTGCGNWAGQKPQQARAPCYMLTEKLWVLRLEWWVWLDSGYLIVSCRWDICKIWSVIISVIGKPTVSSCQEWGNWHHIRMSSMLSWLAQVKIADLYTIFWNLLSLFKLSYKAQIRGISWKFPTKTNGFAVALIYHPRDQFIK